MNCFVFFIIVLQISFIIAEILNVNQSNSDNELFKPFFKLSDFRRQSKILTYGNKTSRRNFMETIEISKANNVENINSILKYVPFGKPIAILLHDDDDYNSNENNRENYITKLINNSIGKHEFLLMKFNSSGVTSILENTYNNIENFQKLISHKSEIKTYLGYQEKDKSAGAVFFSLLKATRFLPENSGIIIFTSGKIEDEDIAQLTINEITSKNIKLFLVWESEYPSKSQNERLIAEAVDISEGYIFTKNQKQNQKLYSATDNSNYLSTSLILNRLNLNGENTITFPVDSGAISIQINLPKEFVKCKLTTPTNRSLNMLSVKNVIKFMESDIHLEETTNEKIYHITKPLTGIWKINIQGIQSVKYNVKVFIQNDFFVNTQIVKRLQMKDNYNSNVLKLDVHGSYKKIDSIVFVNENGEEYYENDLYKLKETEQIKNNGTEKELSINIQNIPNNTYYIKTSGKDNNGNPFVRLSYVNRDPYTSKLQPITIDVGEGSELLAIPNQSANIYFKIKNNRDQPFFLTFNCRSTRRILHFLNPTRAWINARQTLTVILNTQIIPEAGANFRDEITFRATGYYSAQKIAYITVSDRTPYDNESPRMWHTYSKSCSILNRCEEEDWNIEVTAQDGETGLRELSSLPEGLYFPTGYISGTKEPVIGYYTASCCVPKLQLIATDVKNNRRIYTADAYHAPLGAGAIAAIVLSVIIILAIIIGIIIFCRYKKTESDSFDLPTYRSPTSRY